MTLLGLQLELPDWLAFAATPLGAFLANFLAWILVTLIVYALVATLVRRLVRNSRTKLDEGTDATTLAAAQADVDKKRLAVADAEAALAGATLVAPFDGTVLQTKATPGSLIGATSQILTVANLKNLQVVASVD